MRWDEAERLYTSLRAGELARGDDCRTHFSKYVLPLLIEEIARRRDIEPCFHQDHVACEEVEYMAANDYDYPTYEYYDDKKVCGADSYRWLRDGIDFDSIKDIYEEDGGFQTHRWNWLFYDPAEDQRQFPNVNYVRAVDWTETDAILFAYKIWCDPAVRQGGALPTGGKPLTKPKRRRDRFAYEFTVPKRCGVEIAGKTFSDTADTTGDSVLGKRRRAECPYSLRQLRAFCRANGIKGYTKMKTHRELVKALMGV